MTVRSRKTNTTSMSSDGPKIPAGFGRWLGIEFKTTQYEYTTLISKRVDNSQSFYIGPAIPFSIVAGIVALRAKPKNLQVLGAIIADYYRHHRKPAPLATKGQSADPAQKTEFGMFVANFGCEAAAMDDIFAEISRLNWVDDNGNPVTATPYIDNEVTPLGQDQVMALLNFRNSLPDPCKTIESRTLTMLNKIYPDRMMTEFLSDMGATEEGDETGGNEEGPPAAWGTELITRLTTGGPNGSMAGQIAVNFMNEVDTTTIALHYAKNLDVFAADDPMDPFVTILMDAVKVAANSTAEGLANYLKDFLGNAVDSPDRTVATVVKGIKDSLPSTGKTIAQLAVFNSLNKDAISKLPRVEQLRAVYTIANSTRSAVEATGSQIADYYQADAFPTVDEFEAVGARSFSDVFKKVGATVANGVIQAAPVIYNTIANSANATNALNSMLPPQVAVNADDITKLPVPTLITLASRIVNNIYNPEANAMSDKAVGDLANRASNLAAQATFDTFNNISQGNNSDSLRKAFRHMALGIANLSPTFSNVTDIGATNLVTDALLQHADNLRQNGLEVGIRACANMLADNPAAEMLYKVHLHRVKNGREIKPRNFNDFLKAAVPVATNIAVAAIPAVIAAL